MTEQLKRQTFFGGCPHDCPDTCAMIYEVDDGKLVQVTGNKEHPMTQGVLCVKLKDYHDHHYNPDRVLHPLKRTGPKGSKQYERISWDAAIQEIRDRWIAIIAKYGAQAIMPYSYLGNEGLVQGLTSGDAFFNRLIPRDALVLLGALRAGPLQRMENAIGIVVVFVIVLELYAQHALRHGVLFIAGHLGQLAVGDLVDHGAGVGAVMGTTAEKRLALQLLVHRISSRAGRWTARAFLFVRQSDPGEGGAQAGSGLLRWLRRPRAAILVSVRMAL